MLEGNIVEALEKETTNLKEATGKVMKQASIVGAIQRTLSVREVKKQNAIVLAMQQRVAASKGTAAGGMSAATRMALFAVASDSFWTGLELPSL